MCAARDRKPGFDSEFTGTVLKIKLRGEIDHHSAVAVRTAIDDMIRSKRPKELIIDMSAVDFMDSSGLGLIMGRYNTMKELGGSVTVADPTVATEKIMKLAGLVSREGYTLVPLSLYFKGSNVKMSLGLCKGKKLYDKRDDAAKRDADRTIEKAMKNRF